MGLEDDGGAVVGLHLCALDHLVGHVDVGVGQRRKLDFHRQPAAAAAAPLPQPQALCYFCHVMYGFPFVVHLIFYYLVNLTCPTELGANATAVLTHMANKI